MGGGEDHSHEKGGEELQQQHHQQQHQQQQQQRQQQERRRRQMRRAQSEAAVNKKSFERIHSPTKTTPHPLPRKESNFSRASSRDNNSKSRSKKSFQTRANSFQKSVTRSPTKKLSRGQSTTRKSSEKPKFAPKAGFAQCSICSRNFAPERISKHKEICAKSTRTKRKVFDVSAVRVEGTEAAQFQGVKVRQQITSVSKNGDWRAKREEFVAALRAARRDARMIKKGVD